MVVDVEYVVIVVVVVEDVNKVAIILIYFVSRAAEGHASLLFAHKSDIRKISLDRKGDTVTIVNNTRYNNIIKNFSIFKSAVIYEHFNSSTHLCRISRGRSFYNNLNLLFII